MKYERLTKAGGYSADLDLTQELGYRYIYQRLSELEDKIERGEIVFRSCMSAKYKVGDVVYFVHIKGFGETIEEASKRVVYELKIKSVYAGKRKVTYTFTTTKFRIEESHLFATRKAAEAKIARIEKEEKNVQRRRSKANDPHD